MSYEVRNKNGNGYFSYFQYLRPESTDRQKKKLFESLQKSIGNQNDDSLQHYEIILGDFNCVLDKTIDKCPPHRTEDSGLNEFKLLMHRHDLFDIWRNNNPKTKRFSFHRGKTKSRIDYIICSNSLSSKLLDPKIKHFPFSDHDICTVKVKLEDIERGPGIWVMNLNTIKSETFISVFNTCWSTWKNQINRFETIQEWWKVAKTKINFLTIDISKQINKGKNKSNIENLEKN